MSRSRNLVILLGNVGADPEVRSTSMGGRVATLSVATTDVWTAEGTKREKTQWHRVICWNRPKGGQLADLVEKYVTKGDRIEVVGKIEYRTWMDRDNVQRYSTEIIATDVIFLGRRGAAEGGTGTPPKGGADSEDIGGAEADDDLPF